MNIKWSLVRSFLAVAEEGSLTAAARALGLSQPTVGRHVQELEGELGFGLFDRHGRGLRLSEQGAALLEPARAMADEADRFARAATGRDADLRGTVRLSANDVMGIEVLPRALAAFARLHPEVSIELVVTAEASNLNRREADMAVRMFRPTQEDLVARRLPDLQLGFFAHRDYLERAGFPRGPHELFRHRTVGFDQDRQLVDGARAMGFPVSAEDFELRTDSILAQAAMVRAGLGIGVMHVGLALRDPALVRVVEQIPVPPLQLWLVCHRDVQHNRRIRALMDHLAGWLRADPYEGPGNR